MHPFVVCLKWLFQFKDNIVLFFADCTAPWSVGIHTDSSGEMASATVINRGIENIGIYLEDNTHFCLSFRNMLELSPIAL